MSQAVDYDRIADTYDRRYRIHDYSGIADTLRRLAAGADDALDVGCGTGHWSEHLRRCGCRVTGVDASREMLRRARSGRAELRLAVGNAEALPFPPDSFDLIVVVNALHHMGNPSRFLEEARRVIRGSGRIASLGLDPSRGADDWYVYDYFDSTLGADLERYPSCERLREWMRAAGFVTPTTEVAQRIREARDARVCLDRGIVAKHATSQLAILDDTEYRAGIDRIRSDISRAEARGRSHELRADLRIYATVAHAPE